jgi:quercetin dioxygenase-like cupin family protein
MKKIDLKIILESFDHRGAVYRGDYYKKEHFLLAEIKKGKRRGGHYHNKRVHHHVLSGKIIYKEIPLTKKGNHKKNYKEIKRIIKNGEIIKTPAYAAHLLIAIEDSIIFETSDENKTTINYQKYRDQIEIGKN